MWIFLMKKLLYISEVCFSCGCELYFFCFFIVSMSPSYLFWCLPVKPKPHVTSKASRATSFSHSDTRFECVRTSMLWLSVSLSSMKVLPTSIPCQGIEVLPTSGVVFFCTRDCIWDFLVVSWCLGSSFMSLFILMFVYYVLDILIALI